MDNRPIEIPLSLEQGSLGSPAARHIRSRTDLQTGMLSALRRFEQEQAENSQGDGA
jgi:hypothetical protein